MTKKNKIEGEKREAFAIRPVRSSVAAAFMGKAKKTFTCGKVALCSEIVKKFKPLVYCDRARIDSYGDFTRGINNVCRTIGTATAVAYAMANHDSITAGNLENQFLNVIVHLPLAAESAYGLLGNLAGGYLHAKIHCCSEDFGIPTLAGVLFGEKSSDEQARRGIIHNIVKNAEDYLKEANPDSYERAMCDVDSTIEHNKAAKEYKDTKREISELERAINESYVKEAEDIETLEYKRDVLEELRKREKETRKPGTLKKIATKIVKRHKDNRSRD